MGEIPIIRLKRLGVIMEQEFEDFLILFYHLQDYYFLLSFESKPKKKKEDKKRIQREVTSAVKSKKAA